MSFILSNAWKGRPRNGNLIFDVRIVGLPLKPCFKSTPGPIMHTGSSRTAQVVKSHQEVEQTLLR